MRVSKYHSRKFLNKGSGMAAMEISADFNIWDKEHGRGKGCNLHADVTISDCSRQITLEFSVYRMETKAGIKEAEARVEKLDNLIQELVKLQSYMIASIDVARELNA